MAKRITFTQRPSLRRSIARIFLRRRSGLTRADDLPTLRGEWSGVRVDPEHLQSYVDVCDIPSSDHLPFHYPHVIASPLQISLLTQPEFPVGLLGCVHVRNHTVQFRPIQPNEVLDIVVSTAGCRMIDKGVEVDLDTNVNVGGENVWFQRTTFLVRQRSTESQAADESAFGWENDGQGEQLETFQVPANIGLAYTKVSRDFNPIHLSKLSARPFGFKRHIVHGMWTVAHVTGHHVHVDGPTQVDVAFKGPLYIPSRAEVYSDGASNLRVYSTEDDRPAVKIAVGVPTEP